MLYILEMDTFLQTCHVGLGPHSAQGKQSDGLRSGNLGSRFLRMIINHVMVAGRCRRMCLFSPKLKNFPLPSLAAQIAYFHLDAHAPSRPGRGSLGESSIDLEGPVFKLFLT